MSELSVTVSLGPKADQSAAQLAGLILHNRTRIDGWTETNLRNRLEKLLPDRACVVLAYARQSRADAPVLIELCGPLRMSPHDVLDHVGGIASPPAFLFFLTSDDSDAGLLCSELGSSSEAAVICCARAAQAQALIGLGCEFSRWWGMRSLLRESVSLAYLAERLEVLVHALNHLLPADGQVEVFNKMSREREAWVGGDVFVRGVDYEKIVLGAREEQIADTLKRLADAAFAPRNLAQSLAEHAASSQALLWFTELAPSQVDFEWVSGTRFAQDVLGPNSRRLGRRDLPDSAPVVSYAVAEDFLGEFVEVEQGTYRIGTDDASAASEPPAQSLLVEMAGFRILRRPVTVADWRAFSTTTHPRDDANEALPICWRSAFDVMAFAQIVDRFLRAHKLINHRYQVRLPTEREWEVAARGIDALEYPWGHRFQKGSCNSEMAVGRPTAVGAFSPQGDSPCGCQDMAGNVREWTCSYGGVQGLDWQDASTESLRQITTLRPADRLIVRGGSYSYDADCVKGWMRNTQLAERADGQTGFRLVVATSQA